MRTLVNLGRFVWPIFHIVNVLIVSEFCESSEMPAYLVTNFKQNAEKHHLSKGIGSFDKSVYTIVARRGQEYSFTLKFKKPQTKPFQLYLNLYFCELCRFGSS